MRAWGIGILALAAVSCGGVSLRVIDGPGGAAAAPTSIAVLAFTSEEPEIAGRVGDGCAAGALRAGVRAIERQQVDAMLRERALERSSEVGPDWYRQAGEMLASTRSSSAPRAGRPPATSPTSRCGSSPRARATWCVSSRRARRT